MTECTGRAGVRIFLLLVLTLAATGCTVPRFSVYRAPDFAPSRVRRVIALPFQHETDCVAVGDQIRAALAAEIQAAGCFEVVPAPDRLTAVLATQARRTGRFDELFVAELGRQFGADALLLGTVTAYRPYNKPLIGLKVQIVGTEHGRVLWAADGLWDTSLRAVVTRARSYYVKRHPMWDQLDGWKIMRLSPARFHRFVAYELVEAMRSEEG
jgi:hypothetical protein